MITPKVSVCLITYNHELFIREALDSILSQKTNFDFEVIISNDLSTDKTEEIIKEYLEKYSNVKYLNTNIRLGVTGNWTKCINAAKSKYVAIIEGDDYWESHYKLQQQYDLMEANTSYSFCFHKLKMKFERENDIDEYLSQDLEEREYSLEDVITQKWFIGTCSIFFRKECLMDIPKWVVGLKAMDKPVQLILASKGKIGFINEFMGVYRIHNSGVSQLQWLGRERIFEKSQIKILCRFNKYTKYKYSDLIYPKLYKLYDALLTKNRSFKKDYIFVKINYFIFRGIAYISKRVKKIFG